MFKRMMEILDLVVDADPEERQALWTEYDALTEKRYGWLSNS